MSIGFWLRLNGAWVPIENVEKNVQVAAERPTSEFVSVGGVRHSQSSRRAPRTWQVGLGHSGPETVAALAVAAQGDGGDVWLWDESAARANMLDPLAARGVDAYPVVACGGIPLRSLTQGPSVPTVTVDVPLSANAGITSAGWDNLPYSDAQLVSSGTLRDVLFKVSVPETPVGLTFASAALTVALGGGTGSTTVTAYAASNTWSESAAGPTTNYWNTIPKGSSVGAVTFAASPSILPQSISLSGVAAFAGSDMSLRLSKTAGTGTSFASLRAHPAKPPSLRITYTVDPSAIRAITSPLRPADYVLSAWTDAPASTVLGTIDIGAGPTNWAAAAGTGLRRTAAAFTVPTAADVTLTIPDSDDYLIAGLGLATLDHDFYTPGAKTPVRVKVDDPSLVLDSLWAGEQGRGPRTVTIREVGA